MFAYVILGLWLEARFLIWLGLAVTGLTAVGYFLLPSYFYLWMAPMGGGALFVTGWYVNRFWK